MHDEKGDKVSVDMTLDKAQPNDFDAVLLPGGALNADFLRAEKKAQEFVRSIDQAKKPIAVICHAPWLLVSAGLVKGRTMTSYHTIQDDIRNAGGNWKDEEVIRDAQLGFQPPTYGYSGLQPRNDRAIFRTHGKTRRRLTPNRNPAGEFRYSFTGWK